MVMMMRMRDEKNQRKNGRSLRVRECISILRNRNRILVFFHNISLKGHSNPLLKKII